MTAGFRDEFYGLIPYVSEAPATSMLPNSMLPSSMLPSGAIGRLITVGAIEPLAVTWADHPVRFAGRRWQRPVVDAAALADPTIGGWVRAQLRPKVLVATQTRWIEAVADPSGELIGVTPAISVVPEPGTPGAVSAEHLAVALGSPVVTLVAHRRHGGTALVADAVRLSAAAVRTLPLPVDRAAWDRAVERSRRPAIDWRELGGMLCAAYAVDPEPVLAWWLGLARVPRGPLAPATGGPKPV